MSHATTIGVALDDALLFGPAAPAPVASAVTSCTTDWRQVQPGDVFVAILDDEADGHDFAAQAVKRAPRR